MDAWQQMTLGDEEGAWSQFRRRFPQFLDLQRGQGDLDGEPVPSITWSIAAATQDRFVDPTTGDLMPGALEHDLHVKTLAAFRACTRPEQRLCVLDSIQHPGYWFWPHRWDDVLDILDWTAWKTPVLPDGDHSIFLAEDYAFGLLGHMWEETITVFGAPLLAAFERQRPRASTTVVRAHLAKQDTGNV